MKTLDLKAYCEKLKIDPISTKDLDSIDYKEYVSFYRKSDLKFLDIVKINNKLYMVFTYDEIREYTHEFDDINFANDGLFFSYDNSDEFPYCFMPMRDYDNVLKFSRRELSDHKSWDVKEVYKCEDSEKMIQDKVFDELTQLTQQWLIDTIKTYKYKHIIIK